MKIFRSTCCIQIPSRPVSCTGGWVQLIAEKEMLIVVASLVVQCCAFKKNVVVASRLNVVADVQFTAVKKGPLELLQFIQKYNHGNSVPNIVIMLRIVLTIAVSVATSKRSFSKLKLIKNYLRSSISALWLRNLATLPIEPEPYQPHSISPIGGTHNVTGAQNSVPSPLSSPKKTSTPQIEIWSTRIQWS